MSIARPHLAFLLVTLTGSAFAAPLELRTGTTPAPSSWSFWQLTPDLEHTELGIADKPGGAMLETLVPKDALAALNGGYFLRDFRPAGWVKDGARELGKPNTHSTRGGILAVLGQQVFIGKLADLPFQPAFAIQNSPLLVEPDGSLGIHRDDGRRAARTVACLRSSKNPKDRPLSFILLAPVNTQAPTLKETAELLALPIDKGGFGCHVALNLDGGPSTGAWFGAEFKAKSVPPPVPIGYAIVIKEK